MADRVEKGELALVRRLAGELGLRAAAEAAGSPVPFGDDMADVGSGGLLWTTDMLMDGVDFDSRVHSWRAIGRKAMAVNLSDCAAMAATPVGALCAVSLTNTMSMDDAVELLRGVRDCGAEYSCPLTGGDTNSWDHPTVIAITVAARMPDGLAPVRRDGARPGDGVFVTGPLGGSILGRHITFEPRIALAQQIARALNPHAMIDISDGLSLDLWRICEASGCAAVLDEAGLRRAIHADGERRAELTGRPALDQALFDGEDFELLVALPAGAAPSGAEFAGLIRIGKFAEGVDCRLRRVDGTLIPLERRGWEHFT